MPQDVFLKLAQALDAIPNSFPPSESGIELQLLAKIFEPEEAALAAEMSTEWESAAEISARNGTDAKAAYRTLKTMARKGLIYAQRKDRQLKFRLMPFAVGIYEEQLPRIDKEMAALFEAYYTETEGAFARHSPPINRIVPVEEAVPAGVEIYPFERATEMVDRAKAWGVRECICRIQQRLVGKGCDHELETCLVMAPVEGVFDHSDVTRAISREEAHRILRETEDAGLVHSPGNYRDDHYYI